MDVLANLPSRRPLTSLEDGSFRCSAPRPYLAEHETAPMQLLAVDPTPALLRCLNQKHFTERYEEDRQKKAKKKTPAKRAAAAAAPAPAPGPKGRPGSASKRQRTEDAGAGGSLLDEVDDAPGTSAAHRGSPPGTAALREPLSKEALHAKTIPQLTEVLRARGLPTTRAKKEDLIARILAGQ